jgi:hypothetical protein
VDLAGVKRSKIIENLRGPIPGRRRKLGGPGAFSSGRNRTGGVGRNIMFKKIISREWANLRSLQTCRG